MDAFIPEIYKILESPLEMKILLLAHFFCISCNLMVQVYATSWMGTSLLDGVPEANKSTLKRKAIDVGVG